MTIRPATPADLDAIAEIDSVVESTHYLHVERGGQEQATGWTLERRPLREKLIAPNPIDDDTSFVLKQIASGGDEGVAQVAEHEGQLVAFLLAQPRPQFGVMELLDLRVDFDFRRQGLATVLLFALIEKAKEQELRAVSTTSLTNNIAAADLLTKTGFELSGLDTRRRSNHDLVKEAVSLLWYYEVA
jgi:ribosomal protein S18 acetylase RimI-like enzyme